MRGRRLSPKLSKTLDELSIFFKKVNKNKKIDEEKQEELQTKNYFVFQKYNHWADLLFLSMK